MISFILFVIVWECGGIIKEKLLSLFMMRVRLLALIEVTDFAILLIVFSECFLLFGMN